MVLNLRYIRERLKCCMPGHRSWDAVSSCNLLSFLFWNLQVSEEASVLLLPLCCGNGWPLLSFPASSPKLPLACAFLIYLWLLRWSLCNADPCRDGRCSGNFFLIISAGCRVFSACHTIPSEPTCRRSVHKWLCYKLVTTSDLPVGVMQKERKDSKCTLNVEVALDREITHVNLHETLDPT